MELDEMRRVVYSFRQDHPENFWLNSGFVAVRSNTYAEATVSMGVNWKSGARSIAADEAAIKRTVKSIATEARKQPTKAQQVRYAHDWLTKNNVTYQGTVNMETDATPFSAASGLLSDLSPVCDGYANAFKLICDELGVECVTVWGTAGGDHAWNYVRLDGSWYAVDVTWDDPTVVDTSGNIIAGYPGTSEYFLVGSNTLNNSGKPFSATHIPDNKPYPKLSAEAYKDSGTTPATYTVTFNPNGGKVSTSSKTYKANAALGTLPTPTKTGCTFKGWYTKATGGIKVTAAKKVTSDMTLYAQWNAATTCKITLNPNGGKVSPTSVTVEKGKAYLSKLPTPTRTGYKFAGWYTSKTGGTQITSTSTTSYSRTLYAHWSRGRTYMTVKFDPNGGTVYRDSKTVISGARYQELPTPTRPNYIFKGWYTAKSGGKQITAKSIAGTAASQTLYARWASTATVRETDTDNWTVWVPPYFELPLYSTSKTNKISRLAPEQSSYQDFVCTQKVTLSTGVVRYRTTMNGKTVWFTYSCEMDVE